MRLVQSRVPQKSFLFLLEEKEVARKIKKKRRKLFCGTASEASGGGAERISRDFVQNEFWLFSTNFTKVLPTPQFWGVFKIG